MQQHNTTVSLSRPEAIPECDVSAGTLQKATTTTGTKINNRNNTTSNTNERPVYLVFSSTERYLLSFIIETEKAFQLLAPFVVVFKRIFSLIFLCRHCHLFWAVILTGMAVNAHRARVSHSPLLCFVLCAICQCLCVRVFIHFMYTEIVDNCLGKQWTRSTRFTKE